MSRNSPTLPFGPEFVLDDGLALVALSDRFIGWKNARNYLCNLKPSRTIFATYVVNLNRRSSESIPSGLGSVDSIWAQEQGISTGPRNSLSVPAARGEETNAVCGFVISKHAGIVRAYRHRSTGALWCFKRLALAR